MTDTDSPTRPYLTILRLTMGLTAALLVLPAATTGAPRLGRADKDSSISLFNGKDLDGWRPKIKGYELGYNYADTFRVEDGVLKVRYDKYPQFDGKFGHL